MGGEREANLGVFTDVVLQLSLSFLHILIFAFLPTQFRQLLTEFSRVLSEVFERAQK
jgi:hypothetical protein